MSRPLELLRRLLPAAVAAALIGSGVSVAVAQAPVSAPAAASGAGAPAPKEAAAPAANEQMQEYPLRLPSKLNWSFAGPFGTFDQAQLQRGYQVYKEVCSNCHSMNLVAFRNLGDAGGPHFEEAAVRALAAGYMVSDGPNDAGEMFKRAGRPSDRFPSPFANTQQAAFANGGAAPPDLSTIAKARAPERSIFEAPLEFITGYQEAGPDYIHALLTGFTDPPAGVKVPDGTYYNPYFIHGLSLKMPPPLMDGLVTYSDGSPQTIDQYAKDVSAFLMWAAEPRLVERKEIGFRAVLFLVVFAGLMYLSKRRVWASVAH